MRYAIVYSSKTGNTALLAQTVRDCLREEECLYFGPPSPRALSAGRVYVGFWTDKGTCDGETAQFLAALTGQEVFLFGTAGFGGDAAYFEKILALVKEELPEGTEVVGEYMCQGKMPDAVRRRYEQMEDGPRKQIMLDNFDRALAHPGREDLEKLKRAVQALE